MCVFFEPLDDLLDFCVIGNGGPCHQVQGIGRGDELHVLDSL